MSGNYLILACRNCKANNRVITRKAALAICGKCRWALVTFNPRIASERSFETSNFFMKMLVELTTKLRVVREDFEYESIDLDDAERKLNTCKALSEHLHDYSLQHKIDLRFYSDHLFDVGYLSQDIANEISRRKRMAKLKKGRWKNSLNVVIKVTNFVMRLLNLPTFLHELPEERRLLKSASYKELRR